MPERALPINLLASLRAETHSFCGCIRIEPRDHPVIGFTDTDDDLTINGVVYHAAPGIEVTQFATSTGLSIDNMEATGAFDDAGVTSEDVDSGIYDNAPYEIFLVDWMNPAGGSMILQSGRLGNVELQDDEFTFELFSKAAALNQTIGDVSSPTCRTWFGSPLCKIIVATGTHPKYNTPYRYNGVQIASVLDSLTFTIEFASGQPLPPAGYFRTGRILWTGGANNSVQSEVKSHTVTGGTHRIELQEETRVPVVVGALLRIDHGCLKTLEACFEKENVVNMRAEPYMIGSEELYETT